MTITTTTSNLAFEAALGELQHKRDIFVFFASIDNSVTNRFLSNQSVAAWVREHRPDLIPGNDPAGNSPSDKTISQLFHASYNKPSFQSVYLLWLRTNHV